MDGKFLQNMPLFKGVPAEQFPALLSRLHAAERHFAAGSYVLRAGDAPRFGLLLSGRVHVVQEDFWGHQSIMAQLSPGALFGESFALGSGQSLPSLRSLRCMRCFWILLCYGMPIGPGLRRIRRLPAIWCTFWRKKTVCLHKKLHTSPSARCA